jgi:uncharacterized protein YceK
MKNFYTTFLLILIVTLSGCTGMGDEKKEEELVPTYYNDTQYWNDSHQFNGAPMLVGYTNNTTMHYDLNNFTSHIIIDVVCDFTQFGGVQGYFQIQIYDNDTLIYQNNTSESVIWEVEHNNTSNIIHMTLHSEGFDSDPLTEYADYFILEVENNVSAIIYNMSN